MTMREFAKELRAKASKCKNEGIATVLVATADTLDGSDPPALSRLDSDPKLAAVWLVLGKNEKMKALFVVGARTEEQAIEYAKAQCPDAETLEWAGDLLVHRRGVIGGMVVA